MKAGDLRHPVEVQTYTQAFDSHGGEIGTWATTSTIWASVQTLTGRKLELARQMHDEASIEIRTRLCSTGSGAFDVSNRLKFGDRIFEPVFTVNENERNIMLRAICKEGVTVQYG